MRLLRPLLFTGFISYWLITFLFTMPDNFVSIRFYQQQQLFQSWMYQRWSFFAPPPLYDELLYYQFKNRQTQQVQSFEVLMPVQTAKQQRAPFNWKEEIMDGILATTISGFEEAISKLHEQMSIKNRLEQRPEGDTTGMHAVFRLALDTHYFKTLSNYGKIVAANNHIDTAGTTMNVIITRRMLPRFADRLNKAPREEQIAFESGELPF